MVIYDANLQQMTENGHSQYSTVQHSKELMYIPVTVILENSPILT